MLTCGRCSSGAEAERELLMIIDAILLSFVAEIRRLSSFSLLQSRNFVTYIVSLKSYPDVTDFHKTSMLVNGNDNIYKV